MLVRNLILPVALAAITSVTTVAHATNDTGYDPKNTALLVVDPYNDFMSEGGKNYEATKESREKYNSLDNMRAIIGRARATGMQVVIVPHHRYTPVSLDGWKYPMPGQQAGFAKQSFAEGSWGGQFNDEFGPHPGDVVASVHFGQSGFANTDLAMQLHQRGVERIILIGMLANTCIESTGRYGAEQGFDVTLVKDATAAFSLEGMRAAQVNGPTFARASLSTAELLNRLPQPEAP